MRRYLEKSFDLRWYAWALAPASWAYSWLGRWDAAIADGEAALSAAQRYSDHSVISFAAWILSIAFMQKGELARAVEYAGLAVQQAPTHADKVWSQGFLGWALCRAGEPGRGVEMLSPLVPIFRTGRWRPAECFTLALGEGYWRAGEYDKAHDTLEDLLVIAEQCGMRLLAGPAQRLLGEVAMARNPEQMEEPFAEIHFEKSIGLLREMNAENELALAYAGYGRLRKQQGKISEARDCLTRALEIFDRLGTLIEPGRVRQELAQLEAPT